MQFHDEANRLIEKFREFEAKNDWQGLYGASNEALAKQTAPDNQISAICHTFRSLALLNLGQLEAAVQNINEAKRLTPAWGLPFRLHGNIFLNAGDPNQALSELNEAHNREPDDIVTLLHRSTTHQIMGDLKNAYKDALRATEIQPQNADAINQLGIVLLLLGKLSDAITNFQLAVETNPENPVLFINLANAQSQGGNTSEAIKTLDKAIKSFPNDTTLYTQRGILFNLLGKRAEAIADFDRAILLDPNNIDAFQRKHFTMRAKQRQGPEFQTIADTSELKKFYDDLVETASEALRELPPKAIEYKKWLLFFIFFCWLFVFSLQHPLHPINSIVGLLENSISSAETPFTQIDPIAIISTTVATSFLASPIFWLIRQNHNEQKILRTAIEDYKRKQLLMSFVGIYYHQEDKSSDFYSKALDHLDLRGTTRQQELTSTEQHKAKRGKGWFRGDQHILRDLEKRVRDLEDEVASQN